jgi:hypothetical protein
MGEDILFGDGEAKHSATIVPRASSICPIEMVKYRAVYKNEFSTQLANFLNILQ